MQERAGFHVQLAHWEHAWACGSPSTRAAQGAVQRRTGCHVPRLPGEHVMNFFIFQDQFPRGKNHVKGEPAKAPNMGQAENLSLGRPVNL